MWSVKGEEAFCEMVAAASVIDSSVLMPLSSPINMASRPAGCSTAAAACSHATVSTCHLSAKHASVSSASSSFSDFEPISRAEERVSPVPPLALATCSARPLCAGVKSR